MPLKQDLKEIVKVSRKTFFNPKDWLVLGWVVSEINITIVIERKLFTSSQSRRQGTHQQSMIRLKWTESDIPPCQQPYLILLVFLIMAATLSLCSVHPIFYHGSLSVPSLAFLTIWLSMINACRFRFLALPISQHKPGCAFEEWWLTIAHRQDGG